MKDLYRRYTYDTDNPIDLQKAINKKKHPNPHKVWQSDDLQQPNHPRKEDELRAATGNPNAERIPMKKGFTARKNPFAVRMWR